MSGLLIYPYYGYRFYSPEMGRWVSRDPAEEKIGGVNLYAMVFNASVLNYDPLGLFGNCVEIGTICGFWRNQKTESEKTYGEWEFKDVSITDGDAPGGGAGLLCLLTPFLCVCDRSYEWDIETWQEKTCYTIYSCSTPPFFRENKFTRRKNYKKKHPKFREEKVINGGILLPTDPPVKAEVVCRSNCSALN